MMDKVAAFTARNELKEDLVGGNLLTRDNYHKDWSQSLKDDYASKSIQLNNSLERLNFVSNELLRAQNEIIKINERMKTLENE